MPDHVILLEEAVDWSKDLPALPVAMARDYLTSLDYSARRPLRVINLCRSYRYLSTGYYCSLLAEARGHRVIPTVRTVQDLGLVPARGSVSEELDAIVRKTADRALAGRADGRFSFSVFFGYADREDMREIGRRAFEEFRCPLLKVSLRRETGWRIDGIKARRPGDLPPGQREVFLAALDRYLGGAWRGPRQRRTFRYDLAILHDPDEMLPPSNGPALRKFVQVGRKMGIAVDLIRRADFARLCEYDALLIRETTRLNHHTYRFATRAEGEGIAVLDEPDAILRCTNKVYLAEILKAHRIPTPRTLVVRRDNLREIEAGLPFPVVLKIPDGSFSRGVFKVEDQQELEQIARRLLRDSELILAQEFLYTEYDWRIGVLGRQPLFACKYFMSKSHWQILDHAAPGGLREGAAEAVAIEDVPPVVIRTALRACNLIGGGLYGVDLKLIKKRALIVEINDNPNLDAGVEDAVGGEEIYRAILAHLVRSVESRGIRAAGGPPPGDPATS